MNVGIPTSPSVRCVVFGPSDSGKTSFVMRYATSVLLENPDALCLIFARREKALRKGTAADALSAEQRSALDRVCFKWVFGKNSLLVALSELHLHHRAPLCLLVIEDLLDIVSPHQCSAVVAHLANAASVFADCRIAVTLTPRLDLCLSGLRLFMTHYVCTSSDGPMSGKFRKNSQKLEAEMSDILKIGAEFT